MLSWPGAQTTFPLSEASTVAIKMTEAGQDLLSVISLGGRHAHSAGLQ